MKPALLKTLAIVLVTALVFLGGWLLYHGGWENLKEDWSGNYRDRPHPTQGALALGPDGYYWGVTEDSFTMPGYLYKMKADGSGWKRVHTFLRSAPPPAGTYPLGGLVSDGVDSLLGITGASAPFTGFGTLYKINATTGVLTNLVEFTGKNGPHKGCAPQASLVSDGTGCYWGTTLTGGMPDRGTIFKFSPATGVFTTVVEWPRSPIPNVVAFGPPVSLASDDMGYWWGTTNESGAEVCGAVFKVNASTGELTTIVEFTKGKGGTHPMGGLVKDGQGFLWGVCNGGGKGYGTLFKVNAATGALTTVVEFANKGGTNLGALPNTALVSDGRGFLWGNTYGGGKDVGGTIFKVDITSGMLTTLVEFDTDERTHKGYRPHAPLVSDGHGAFLGTTRFGGKKYAGTIFKIDIATGVLTTLVELGKVGP